MTAPLLKSSRRFDLARLFQPSTIAVIDLDSEPGARIQASLSVGGFEGKFARPRMPPGLALASTSRCWRSRRIRSATR